MSTPMLAVGAVVAGLAGYYLLKSDAVPASVPEAKAAVKDAVATHDRPVALKKRVIWSSILPPRTCDLPALAPSPSTGPSSCPSP
jgi:hypothetical protein